ncbi:MAG: TolC family protein, partial [Zetaproteobacteria bacterium]|nr:TolC family protein [Zetaproteobacteria bacterium]
LFCTLLVLLVAGCAIQPKPFEDAELSRVTQNDRDLARDEMPALSAELTLEEAVARALKFNLNFRVHMMEEALSLGELDAGKFDMLPKMLTRAGYASRSQDQTRTAVDSVTGQPSLANPYLSSSRNHATMDLGLSWNMLDFGASYYAARQNGDRLLIASERRRNAMHLLIQNVRTAFWRALAAESLSDRIHQTVRDAEEALDSSRKVSNERLTSPDESLRYQRNLLESLRLLENVERELASARIELANLMGVSPNASYRLIEPKNEKPAPIKISIQDMEVIALSHNADLRESFYQARIASLETRKMMLKMLPGISFDYNVKTDSDPYLLHKQWLESSMFISFNLLNILSAPSQLHAMDQALQVAQAQRMAMQMTVLTKLHMAQHQYMVALSQYDRAVDIYQVDSQLAELAMNRERSLMGGAMESVSANVVYILSAMRRYEAMAKVHEAGSRLQATLGVEPEIGSVDDMGIPELQGVIQRWFSRWSEYQSAHEIEKKDLSMYTPKAAIENRKIESVEAWFKIWESYQQQKKPNDLQQDNGLPEKDQSSTIPVDALSVLQSRHEEHRHPKTKIDDKSIGKRYFVQVASYRSLRETDAMKNQLRALDYTGQVQSVDLPDKGHWYRVFVGGFSQKSEAEVVMRNIQKGIKGSSCWINYE